MTIRVQVLRRFTLNGTIDGHDPLGATFRITGGERPFRLTVISVNWGRGYDAGEFKGNVLNVLERTDEMEYVVLLMQEIDEADAADEHEDIRKALNAIWEPGTTLVEWWTREPIAVSPGVTVRRQRKVMTMDQGSAIGAPHGTGPRRFFTSCIAVIHGVRIGLGCQHPHRVDRDWSRKDQDVVEAARKRGQRVTEREIGQLVALTDVTIDGGDFNDPRYPLSHPRQKIANKRGLDYLRYVVG